MTLSCGKRASEHTVSSSILVNDKTVVQFVVSILSSLLLIPFAAFTFCASSRPSSSRKRNYNCKNVFNVSCNWLICHQDFLANQRPFYNMVKSRL